LSITKSHMIRPILIWFNHLRLGLPSGLFPSGFSTNILYAFLISHIRATCPAHFRLIWREICLSRVIK
jgi:hypothetical protein